jgi:hypothetical protein
MYKGDLDSPEAYPEPFFIEGAPQSIAEHWHGMENVRLAFTMEDKTYLVEQWDDEGNFRYLCLTGSDYSRKHDLHLEEANFYSWSVLAIPAEYYEEGFTTVHAVLQSDEHLFLLNEDTFVHFNAKENAWEYPRPISRKWDDLPLNLPDIQEFTADLSHIHTAFTGANGTTYFFSENAFLGYGPEGSPHTPIQEVRDFWGHLDNNIQVHEVVNAAVVVQGATYLFSKDQYVRYSTDDYRFVDEGYPKLILDELRNESGFEHLPETFEADLAACFEQETYFDAVLASERTVYVLANKKCYLSSTSVSATYDTDRFGHLKKQYRGFKPH